MPALCAFARSVAVWCRSFAASSGSGSYSPRCPVHAEFRKFVDVYAEGLFACVLPLKLRRVELNLTPENHGRVAEDGVAFTGTVPFVRYGIVIYIDYG